MDIVKFIGIVCFIGIGFSEIFAEEITYEDKYIGNGKCSIYPGYEIAPGYDERVEYVEDMSVCCRRCAKAKQCKGWTYSNNRCNFKQERILVPSIYGTEITSGFNIVDGSEPTDVESVKTDQFLVKSPKGTATCSMVRGIISNSASIRTLSGDQASFGNCCHECSITKGCVGWTQIYSGVCILKSSTKIEEGQGSKESVSGVLL